ncbi:nitrogen fixation NifU-like protein [Metamycoplasma subdolum]|uniref:Nitrogen fixation NifU-like protein n=1 Tax=Metamycoplasma subdolum TaxID=92407 RepID=A0A3M0A1J0_9BACT|nr:nitrogen fixation NifU-like protein [Metamycoplasma subdolum]
MTSYSNQEKQKIIFEAYANPKHKLQTLNTKNFIFEKSNICVDNLKLNLIWEKEVLKNAEYSLEGCAVFSASVELVIELIVGKNKQEINEIIDIYEEMINGKEINNKSRERLEKLIVFEKVKTHLNRLECASIIIRAIRKGL